MYSKTSLIELLIRKEVLRFGEFTLKSGKVSPYFFNTGKIDDGAAIQQMSEAYADTVEQMPHSCDVLFGPAYKGIPIVVGTAVALAQRGQNLAVAYNRKEAKAHGEGGRFVGASVVARNLILEDVLTAGTAVREAVEMIRAEGGTIVGVIIALDRQERVNGENTAVAQLAEELDAPVRSLLNLQDVIGYLDSSEPKHNYSPNLIDQMRDYQSRHCVV